MLSGGRFSAPTVNVKTICRQGSSQEGMKSPSTYRLLHTKPIKLLFTCHLGVTISKLVRNSLVRLH